LSKLIHNGKLGKGTKIGATRVILRKKLPEVNNDTMGENLPNLVTLVSSLPHLEACHLLPLFFAHQLMMDGRFVTNRATRLGE
jgi:hypothetical protein